MKKTPYIIGIIVCAIMCLCGLLILVGTFAEGHYITPPSSRYDYGYAIFNSDFYTYMVNNTSLAAAGARTAAYDLYVLISLVNKVGGLSMLFLGILGICYFTKEMRIADVIAAKVATAVAAAIAAAGAPAEEAPAGTAEASAKEGGEASPAPTE